MCGNVEIFKRFIYLFIYLFRFFLFFLVKKKEGIFWNIQEGSLFLIKKLFINMESSKLTIVLLYTFLYLLFQLKLLTLAKSSSELNLSIELVPGWDGKVQLGLASDQL